MHHDYPPDNSYFCDYHCGMVDGEPELILEWDRMICPDCTIHYERCYDCGEYFHQAYLQDSPNVGHICDSCLDEYPQCDSCGEEFSGDSCGDTWTTLCESCYTNEYYHCDYCGDLRHVDNPCDCNEDECDCEMCRPSSGYTGGLSRRVTATLTRGIRRYGTTFGLEVETMFNGYCPFELGDYHSGTLVGPEFISGWQAEEDCTVDGEFISPPLSGPEGIAEIIATLGILDDADAYMDESSGQHTTVAMPDGAYTGVQVQKLMYAMEESLFALTGDFNRMFNTSYSERCKYSYWLENGRSDSTRESVAALRDSKLIEFRYPPGTLDARQVAINVGVTQLVAHLAADMDETEIEELYLESRRIEKSGTLAKHERIHEQVQLGLMILADHGWTAAGQFDGLPYDPEVSAHVQITDHAHDHNLSVNLPLRNEIIGRMHESLYSFYITMEYDCGITFDRAEELAAEAGEIVGETTRMEVAA